MEGQDCLLEIKPDQKIDELKIMALNNFINPSESMKSSLYHKVLLVRTSKILGEERTVTQEGLKNNGRLWPIELSFQHVCWGGGTLQRQYNLADGQILEVGNLGIWSRWQKYLEDCPRDLPAFPMKNPIF